MNQSEFLAITCNLIKAREKSARLVLVLLLIGSKLLCEGLSLIKAECQISYNKFLTTDTAAHCRYPASNETPAKLVISALLKDFLKKKS